jgi:hypothetical protein
MRIVSMEGGSSLLMSPMLMESTYYAANHSYTCRGTTSFNKLRIVCCYFHVFLTLLLLDIFFAYIFSSRLLSMRIDQSIVFIRSLMAIILVF